MNPRRGGDSSLHLKNTDDPKMKLLALVLALSANSRPDATNHKISSIGFRKLSTWPIMATRHLKRLLTRSARKFDAFGGADYADGMCAPYHRAVHQFTSSGDSESPVTASEVDHDAKNFGSCPYKPRSRPGCLCLRTEYPTY